MMEKKKKDVSAVASRICIGFFALMLILTVVSRTMASLTVPMVTTANASKKNIIETIEGSGTVINQSDEFVEVLPNQKVMDIAVETGTKVEEGQELFTYSLPKLQEAYESKLVELQELELTVRKKRLEDEKDKEKSSISAEELTLERAKLDLEDGELNLTRSIMKWKKSLLEECDAAEDAVFLAEENLKAAETAYKEAVDGKTAAEEHYSDTLLAKEAAEQKKTDAELDLAEAADDVGEAEVKEKELQEDYEKLTAEKEAGYAEESSSLLLARRAMEDSKAELAEKEAGLKDEGERQAALQKLIDDYRNSLNGLGLESTKTAIRKQLYGSSYKSHLIEVEDAELEVTRAQQDIDSLELEWKDKIKEAQELFIYFESGSDAYEAGLKEYKEFIEPYATAHRTMERALANAKSLLAKLTQTEELLFAEIDEYLVKLSAGTAEKELEKARYSIFKQLDSGISELAAVEKGVEAARTKLSRDEEDLARVIENERETADKTLRDKYQNLDDAGEAAASAVRRQELCERALEEAERGITEAEKDITKAFDAIGTADEKIAEAEQKREKRREELKEERKKERKAARQYETAQTESLTVSTKIGADADTIIAARSEVEKLKRAVDDAKLALSAKSSSVLSEQKNAEIEEEISSLEYGSYDGQLERKQAEADAIHRWIEQEGRVYAPIAGVVTEIGLQKGKSCSGEEIVKLAKEGCGFEAGVTKEEAKKLAIGDEIHIRYKSDDLPEATQITSISEADENNMVCIKGALTGNDYKIGAGISFTIEKSLGSFDCCVPIETIRSDGSNDNYVLMLQEQEGILGTEYIAEKRLVKVLEKNETYAALEYSLHEEENVIVSYNKPVSEGDKVRLEE